MTRSKNNKCVCINCGKTFRSKDKGKVVCPDDMKKLKKATYIGGINFGGANFDPDIKPEKSDENKI